MCIYLKGKLLSPAGCSRENKGFVTACQTPSGQGSIFWRLGHLSWKFLAALSKETNWNRFQQLHWINGIENKEELPDRSSSWERWKKLESSPSFKGLWEGSQAEGEPASCDWFRSQHHHLLIEADNREELSLYYCWISLFFGYMVSSFCLCSFKVDAAS